MESGVDHSTERVVSLRTLTNTVIRSAYNAQSALLGCISAMIILHYSIHVVKMDHAH